jgi:hypothetical protein
MLLLSRCAGISNGTWSNWNASVKGNLADGGGLNTSLFYSLVVIAIVCLTSVITSGKDAYTIPLPIGGDYSDYNIPGDPRHLPQSLDIAYSLDLLRSSLGDRRIGSQELVVGTELPVYVTGWAFDRANDGPSLAVYTQVDHGPIHRAPVALARADVARTFNSDNIVMSGFSVPVDLNGITAGDHALRLWITTWDGLAMAHPKSLVFRVTARGRVKPR